MGSPKAAPLQHRCLRGVLHQCATPAALQTPDLVLGMELHLSLSMSKTPCTPKLHLCSTKVCMGCTICMQSLLQCKSQIWRWGRNYGLKKSDLFSQCISRCWRCPLPLFHFSTVCCEAHYG